MKKYIELSVVVPISRMAGKMELMFSWISNTLNRDVQIILVHDIQDPRTSDELVQFMSRISQSNVKLIEGIYNSPGLARNAGLELAEGFWVQFIDSDDLPSIEGSLSLIEDARKESDILVGSFTYWDARHNKKWRLASTGDARLDLSLNPGIWRLIFRRERIHTANFSQFRMGEDQLFLLENRIFNCQLEFSDREIYRYSVGQSGQLTAQSWALKELELLIPQSIRAYKDSNPNVLKYDSILVTRQILTLAKHHLKSHELSIAWLFNLGIRDLPLSRKVQIGKALILILRYRSKYIEC